MLTPTTTLAELVTERPQAARVLHRHGLDFCCKGRRTIEDALEGRDLGPRELLAEVEAAARPPADTRDWQGESLDTLIQHILTRYHAPLRGELDRLQGLAEKVERTHGGRDECPNGLAGLLSEIRGSVLSHLGKEEQILFPAIQAGRGRQARMPVQAMIREHEDHGRNLIRIRDLTGDLTPPSDACNSWRALYQGLEEMEFDLMEHIHLENNILFPRALVE